MSLRMRLILSFTLVVVLCLGIIAIAVTVVLQSNRDRYAAERLTTMARPIYVQVQSLSRGQVTWRDLLSNLEDQADKNEIYIFLSNSDGKIIKQIPPDDNSLLQISDLLIDNLPTSGIKPGGGIFTTPDGSDFIYTSYHIAKLFDTAAISVSRLENLTLAIPRSGTMTIMAGLLGPFLRLGILALAVSVVIAFFIARSVYRPIRRVTEAADKIAEGQFDQEVPVAGPKEIKSLALHFNEMASKVKESQQQLRHFVADVSHQLRTPLTSIQGFAQAILDGTAGDSETRQKAAGVIDDEAKRMIKQVEELLELSRMQSGQLEMARELVDVKELLLHCQEVFSLRAEETGIRFRTEIEPLMPVVGDDDRLEQVFGNLLDNALKNTPAKGEISITGRNSGASAIEITISDTGPGIPPEQLPYVFERFYQASGLRTGFGLGLAIVKEIVTGHGGTITVKSEPGEGTSFIISLPASTTAGSDNPV